MSLSPDTLDAVKALIANDDALLKRLSQVTTPDEAARIVTEAASAKGLPVNTEAFAAHFRAQLGHEAAELSDESLAEVAGGIERMKSGDFTAMSIFSMGIACIVYSHEHASTAGYMACSLK